MTKFKDGDYIEVMGNACVGIKVGEQGIVIDAEQQNHLQVIFPARNDVWAETGWLIRNYWLKLVFRPRSSRKQKGGVKC